MLTVSICSFEELENFDSLSKEHWNSFNNKQPSFDKNILKNFNVIQAKDKENDTVGYLLFIVFKAPYYNELWCQVDMFYLKPEFRKQGIGNKMFKVLEEEVKKQGASKIMSSFNLKQPLEGFYKKLGYIETHVAVAKDI